MQPGEVFAQLPLEKGVNSSETGGARGSGGTKEAEADVAFLSGQAWEYSHLGFGLTAGTAASSFFLLTGFHGLHVACGIGVLVYLLVRSSRERRRGQGATSPGTSGMVDAGTYYWHFVDAVWVVVFVVVYLL